MQFRTDPKTGKSLSVLGFGCMRLPGGFGRVDMAEAEKIIGTAIEQGVNYFDTAYIYPGNEAAMGQILTNLGARERIYIATKLPVMLCRGASDFDRYFDAQRKRLRTDRIDYYLMHALANPAQWQRMRDFGLEAWLESKRKAGQIGQIGFSFHGKRDDFALLLDAYAWDFCQIQYNYANVHYQAGLSGLKLAAEKGLPVIIMEPMLGGGLTTGLPEKATDIFHEVNAVHSPAAWSLRWLWNQPEVTVVLSGMRSMEELEENLRTADGIAPGMLTRREMDAIDEVDGIVRASIRIPCTSCHYCMPCPQGIDIPGCLAAYNTSYRFSRIAGFKQYVFNTAAMTRTPHYAGHCTRCGLCETRCPQDIPIRASLRAVVKRLEPFWFKAIVSAFRWTRRGRKSRRRRD